MCTNEIGIFLRGLGWLRPRALRSSIAASQGRVSWFEGAVENYMVTGRQSADWLEKNRSAENTRWRCMAYSVRSARSPITLDRAISTT